MTAIDCVVEASESLYRVITEELSKQSTKKYNHDKFSLLDLDNWRSDVLPATLADRYKETNKVWLNKDELILLMDWKLAKGVYRPMLPKLIKSNDRVEQITEEGYEIFLNFVKDTKSRDFWHNEKNKNDYITMIKASFKKLCELRGVGPATASLILSLCTHISKEFAPPFFSDESFIYYIIEPNRPDTKIKYNMKEYTQELLPLYFDIMNRHSNLSMNLLEKGGWAIKTYDTFRIDKLIDIKLPFEASNDVLLKFEDFKEAKEEPRRKKLKSG
ncbi:uncharacterized protein PRCAT00000324001 [Priceomyces carsonii]|uniref:uncharacterized protein n=1 Tax=Priceomyces carsonii TaxID=28549 RepID=UPI002ED77BDC|nr:unnamed protein product [Priceomyces carsonii]